MLLELFGFLNLSFTDILDILLLGTIIFLCFRWIRNSTAMNIFLAIIMIFLMMMIVDALHMKLMCKLFSTFIDVGVVALIVIFQPEIRHFLMKIGASAGQKAKWRELLEKLLGVKQGDNMAAKTVNEITEACRAMSSQKTGALIVIPHSINLENIIETGDKIDAQVSRRLILNLFFKNSPLHDGAVIISGDRIVAARCTLPISDKPNIPPSFGMRHKAAIGISEETDADVIVVSEETGHICFVRGGNASIINNINELKLLLGAAVSGQGDNAE